MTVDGVACPADISQVSPEWVEAALREAGVNGALARVEAEPIGTGQMALTYRLRLSYLSGSGPATLVLKLSAVDPTFRKAVVFVYRCESRFYRDVAPRIAVRVPHCYANLEPDNTGLSALLLEDFPDARVGDQLVGCTLDQALAAVTNIAGLHAATWNDHRLQDLDWIAPNGAADPDAATGVLQDAIEHFLVTYDLSTRARSALISFHDRAGDWRDCEAGQPSSLTHGDYRPDNILFGEAPDPTVALDWQTTTVAPPLRDVALLVGTGLQPQDRQAGERQVLHAYQQALSAAGIRFSYDECWDAYVSSLLYPLAIVAGGARYSARTNRGDRMFTTMAERAAQAIEDHSAFTHL